MARKFKPNKTTTQISMSLDVQLLELIDALAVFDSRNRSNYIANILHKTAYEAYSKSRETSIRKLGDAYFKDF